MFNPAQSLSRLAYKWWCSLTGKKPSFETTSTRPGVFFHDPAASQPHDLDDPFFDSKVQDRVADVIAASSKKK
jgi:hypothetical protein